MCLWVCVSRLSFTAPAATGAERIENLGFFISILRPSGRVVRHSTVGAYKTPQHSAPIVKGAVPSNTTILQPPPHGGFSLPTLYTTEHSC